MSIFDIITNLYPDEVSLAEMPTCRRCYSILQGKEASTLHNPSELCCDCTELENATYNWEIA
jgi:hypothetical protein